MPALPGVKRFFLANASSRSRRLMFFETRWTSCPSHPQPSVREPRENRGRLRHCNGLQTPRATDRAGGIGKAGERTQARSQDTGLAVLVMVPQSGTNFSVKEKDEASPLRVCAMGFAECLHSPFCRGLKVFYFPIPRWSLNRQPVPRNVFAEQN